MTVESYLEKIQGWLEASGISETRLGLLATANARAIPRIRDGTAKVKTLDSVLDYICKHPVRKQK